MPDPSFLQVAHPGQPFSSAFRWRAVTRLFGILLLLFSPSFIPSIGVSLYYDDGEWGVFCATLAITIAAGMLLWWPNRNVNSDMKMRDGFLVVTLFWIILPLASALPFILGLHLGLVDALFESVSGFTTTGATTIIGIDDLPRSMLYHRQQIQFLGGMGVIVLAVAVLPLLGIGGMQLYRAEVSGVSKEDKLTPRIAHTARALWMIYFFLTLCCAAAYWAAGMSLFDAIGHAYATVATGGFSTHDASMAFFDNEVIEFISIVFMMAGGMNFALHFLAWKNLSPKPYENDPEFRAYVFIFLTITLIIALSLYVTGAFPGLGQSLRYSAFQTASILTSTGFTTANFALWPLYIPMLLAISAFIGGCVGSTAGGIKVLRIVLLGKLGLRQLRLSLHPRGVFPMRLGKEIVSTEILFSVLGFGVLYVSISILLTTAMMGAGLDMETAFGAVMATINLCGPGLGGVAVTFADTGAVVKCLGIFSMLVGRLEIFTLLILFLPRYWRD